MTNQTTPANPSVGTELKINVSLDIGNGLTMDDADFSVKFYNDMHSEIVEKDEMIRVDENNYVARLDTTKLGAGDVYARVTAYVPDPDFESGLRREVLRAFTGLTIVS